MSADERGAMSSGIAGLAALAMVGCVVAGEGGPAERGRGALSESGDRCWETTLSWGDGDGQVGLIPAATERAARGPQAIALGTGTEVLVLDAVNGRVLAVAPSGAVRIAVRDVAPHSEDLATGPDGAIATYSPLRSVVSIADPSGAPAGEVAVSRSLRHVRGISLLSSRRVLVHSAHQETFPIGSPAAPLSLQETLHGKREGAAQLTDDRGLAVRALADGTVALQIVRALALDQADSAGERDRVVSSLPLPGRATAGRVAGVADGLACVALEQLGAQQTVTVQRRVVCVDVTAPGAAALFEQTLPPPRIYQPARAVAIGGSPLSIAWLQPTESGLAVQSCPLARQAAGEVSR